MGRAVAAIDARAGSPGTRLGVSAVFLGRLGEEEWMPWFSNAQVPEAVQPFWAALQRGEFIADVAVAAGTYRKQGTRWVAACGGVRPRRGRNLKGRCLSFGEREEIALARARGESMRAIARRLGRSPSTISRELGRNADRSGYRATTAHALAHERASRPKPAKLAANLALRQVVQDDLCRRFSPEQIAGRLRRRFPDDPEMWVSTETIYQSLFVQSRGALRRELTRYLRTGRALREPAAGGRGALAGAHDGDDLLYGWIGRVRQAT